MPAASQARIPTSSVDSAIGIFWRHSADQMVSRSRLSSRPPPAKTGAAPGKAGSCVSRGTGVWRGPGEVRLVFMILSLKPARCDKDIACIRPGKGTYAARRWKRTG